MQRYELLIPYWLVFEGLNRSEFVIRRAVVFVGHEHDDQERVGAEEVLVLRRRVLERAVDRLELVLEAAALIADRRHAGEGRRQILAARQVAGVVELVVVDEVDATGGRRAAGHGRLAQGDELAAVAARVALAVRERERRGAEVGGDDADVIPGRVPWLGEVVEQLDEQREPRLQLRLTRRHGRRVIDQEQEVDLVLDVLLDANRGLLRDLRSRGFDRRVVAGECTDQRDRRQGHQTALHFRTAGHRNLHRVTRRDSAR